MWCKVLKPFPYAHDHHNVVTLEADQVVEIDDGVIEGLSDEGFIGEASDEEIAAAQAELAGEDGAVVVTEPVEIPADWEALNWMKKRALAMKVTGGPVANKETAEAVIRAELARREGPAE